MCSAKAHICNGSIVYLQFLSLFVVADAAAASSFSNSACNYNGRWHTRIKRNQRTKTTRLMMDPLSPSYNILLEKQWNTLSSLCDAKTQLDVKYLFKKIGKIAEKKGLMKVRHQGKCSTSSNTLNNNIAFVLSKAEYEN